MVGLCRQTLSTTHNPAAQLLTSVCNPPHYVAYMYVWVGLDYVAYMYVWVGLALKGV